MSTVIRRATVHHEIILDGPRATHGPSGIFVAGRFRAGGMGHLKLRPCRALRISVSDEEMNDFPTVHAASPLCISSHVRVAGDTEYTQAVFATDDVVSVPVPNCLDWFAVNVRRSSS